MIEVIGVDVMWFGPWCLYTILITLLVLFNHNDKRGKGMDNPTIVSEDKAENTIKGSKKANKKKNK